ncbi:hypothetical protein H4R24_004898 [Coemansia sp. RSA 988]|nr:hypothetical protein H4R24_004898 [Coemansia sp. RSA 988]
MSDTEEQPQKVAKRKSSAEIRKARRERERAAREGTLETQQSAHQYLQTWEQDRKQWKFNKAKQLWIVRHLYSETRVPAPLFDIAVRYLAGSKGMLRDSMLKDARLIANPAEAITEQQKQLRIRALGLMPTHVTKREAKANKRVNDTAAVAAAANAAETSTADTGEEIIGDKPTQTTNADEDGDNNEDDVTDVPLSIRERADRVIEVLTCPIPVETEDTEGDTKRKQPDSSDSDDSDAETMKKSKKRKSKDKTKGSKVKKDSKDTKAKKDRKEKKDKDKKERKHKNKKEKKDKKHKKSEDA